MSAINEACMELNNVVDALCSTGNSDGAYEKLVEFWNAVINNNAANIDGVIEAGAHEILPVAKCAASLLVLAAERNNLSEELIVQMLSTVAMVSFVGGMGAEQEWIAQEMGAIDRVNSIEEEDNAHGRGTEESV